MAVGGIIVSIYREHAVHGDAGGVGGDKDDRLLAVGVTVGWVGFTHDDVDLAARVTGARGPPFLYRISLVSYAMGREYTPSH